MSTATLPAKYHLVVRQCGQDLPEAIGCADNMVVAQMILHNACLFTKDVVYGTVKPDFGIIRTGVYMYRGEIILREFKGRGFQLRDITCRIDVISEIKEHYAFTFKTGSTLDLWLHVISV